ncbi:hypothetical protein F0145_17740 [Adhaeribacter rhizoryzae]|uniref:Uncharacterized protein n=1 Tax=Adhaeribacter rhizoryzae TaxID=2607907 RepID=A0A5M6D954_9BACT|nr:hypothetical protein F0145_17740 [Adhaeribacter rhizoryzae]
MGFLCISFRQYRILQSRLLYCLPQGKPACGLLTGSTNLPLRDLHPLEYFGTLQYLMPILGAHNS